ncbi:MAG: phosphoribosyltransferase [Ferruginibacter sp.]|uniref:phosphoribosyltransferase n=1 Tax=Ferruginibacter sp. TaxID=1940288 RepID=UPI00265A8F5A|nr:phosphoribosyltransferase family protein [Ferruginibacter sp.]MDB5275680.1 phosphoribosyltransferase [Ferruginibacter sp.]
MFYDRKDAALQLAKALEKYKDQQAVVLGIPRGGAVTGYYVALHLNAVFSLLVSRKLGHPNNPEYAVGAIAEDGTIHLNDTVVREVSQEEIDTAVAQQKKEIERRINVLRQGQPLPEIKNRIVLIVDDGIATGATIFAAIKMCKKKEAAKIVVAAPVSGNAILRQLRKEADEVVILETPAFYHAVSQAYESFGQVTDDEALGLLEKWQKQQNNPRSESHVPNRK